MFPVSHSSTWMYAAITGASMGIHDVGRLESGRGWQPANRAGWLAPVSISRRGPPPDQFTSPNDAPLAVITAGHSSR